MTARRIPPAGYTRDSYTGKVSCQAPFFCAQVGRAEALGITRCSTRAAALLVHDALEIIVRRHDGSPFPYAERRREPVEQVAAVCWAHAEPRLLGKREAATLRARGEVEAAPHVTMLLLLGGGEPDERSESASRARPRGRE